MASAQRDRRVVHPRSNTPEALVRDAFRAALQNDREAYERITLPNRDDVGEEWERFSERAPRYLVSDEPITFVVTERASAGLSRVVISVRDQQAEGGTTRQIRLQRHGSGWRILQNDL